MSIVFTHHVPRLEIIRIAWEKCLFWLLHFVKVHEDIVLQTKASLLVDDWLW